ncbi:hypothetical protein [Pararhodobacter sp.]|uniref:hypothetical protein n=1 Tax=Pararhodobacter sp. TaxID=2127056 RepID=UPI002AFFB236|nr:hypothetical protein [Pararhodobacter sp.]
MRAYDSATLALLASGRMVTHTLVQFDFASGTYGFWDGAGKLTYGGLTYIGAGALIGMDEVTLSGSLESTALGLTLTSIANSDLTPDTLASIEAEQYHRRPVTLRRAYIHPDTRALVSVQRAWRGTVDQVTHEDAIGGQAVLKITCESVARDLTRKGWRIYSDVDQRRIDPTDGGMKHATLAGAQRTWWGRLPGSQKK